MKNQMRATEPWLIGMTICYLLAQSTSTRSPLAIDESIKFRLTFIQVGNGDSTLIQDGQGFDVLIDGGKEEAGPIVLDSLRQNGVDDLEIVVATHAAPDHVGGLTYVLNAENPPVERIYFNGIPRDNETWHEFAQAVEDEGLALETVTYPQTFAWGPATAYILNPDPNIEYIDEDQASIVIMLVYAQMKWLLTADIDSVVEADLAKRGAPLQAPILKVPHHGHETGTSAAFLEAVQPQHAILSVGDNQLGRPDAGVLQRLVDSGARLWRTDMHGTVVVTSDGTSYQIFNTRTLLPVLLRFP
jgi:beta-lactamase superfamily II metal-dependent hydrolase